MKRVAAAAALLVAGLVAGLSGAAAQGARLKGHWSATVHPHCSVIATDARMAAQLAECLVQRLRASNVEKIFAGNNVVGQVLKDLTRQTNEGCRDYRAMLKDDLEGNDYQYGTKLAKRFFSCEEIAAIVGGVAGLAPRWGGCVNWVHSYETVSSCLRPYFERQGTEAAIRRLFERTVKDVARDKIVFTFALLSEIDYGSALEANAKVTRDLRETLKNDAASCSAKGVLVSGFTNELYGAVVTIRDDWFDAAKRSRVASELTCGDVVRLALQLGL